MTVMWWWHKLRRKANFFCVRHAVCFSRLSARTCICNVFLQPCVIASASNYANKCRYIRLHHHTLLFLGSLSWTFKTIQCFSYLATSECKYTYDLKCILWNFQNKTHSFLTWTWMWYSPHLHQWSLLCISLWGVWTQAHLGAGLQ